MTRLIITAIAIAGLSGTAQADCYGPPNFMTCEDAYGNRVEISRIGNQTITYGYDAGIGAEWRREDYQLGSTRLSHGTTPWGENWDAQNGPGGYFYQDDEGLAVSPPNRRRSRR